MKSEETRHPPEPAAGVGRGGALGRRVAVTGIGPVCSVGVGREDFWRGLLNAPLDGEAPAYDPRRDGVPVEPIRLHRPDWARTGEVIAAGRFAGLPPDPELRLSAAAAWLAAADAGVEQDLAKAAMVLTYEAPGLDVLLRGFLRDLLERPPGTQGAPEEPAAVFQRLYEAHKGAAYSTHSFLHLHLLSRALGIHGHTSFVNNACASGLYAFDAAARLIAGGRTEAALAVAAESPCFPTKQRWFAEGGLYSSDGCLRPFDRERTGLVLGEGAGAVLLESLERARARGARVYGEYLGGSFNQEGWKVTVPNFSEPFYELAIRGACDEAHLDPARIGAIFAHGAGTALSDAYEAKGLAAVFGEWPRHPPLTALKGYFGHTLGASGLIELGALLLALEHGVIPAAAGFRAADPKLKVQPTPAHLERRFDVGLKLSNGFAGFNAAVLVGKV